MTVRKWVHDQGLPLETLGEGDELRGGALVCRILHPDPRFVTTPSVSENSKSLVVRCEDQGVTILLPGDIGEDAMERLCNDYGAGLKTDVLVLPHHGHYQAALSEFVKLVDPRLALASSPAVEVAPMAEALPQERSIPLWITGTEGAIIITYQGGSAHVLGWKSGRTMDFRPAGATASGERSGDG